MCYHSDRKQLWVEFEIFKAFYTVTLTCLCHDKQNKRYPLSRCYYFVHFGLKLKRIAVSVFVILPGVYIGVGSPNIHKGLW